MYESYCSETVLFVRGLPRLRFFVGLDDKDQNALLRRTVTTHRER